MAVRQQKNIERLISRCESILSGRASFEGREWKLAKYVSALDEQIKELAKFPSVDPDLMTSFRQRASVLHNVLRTDEKFQATPISPAHSPEVLMSPLGMPSSEDDHAHRRPRGNELLMRANSRREESLRDQLFSKFTDASEEGADSLRHRNSSTLEHSLESVLEQQQRLQDEAAEDMISMARSLKHTSLLAKDIILNDNKVLDKASKVSDENIEGVERETGRLKEENRGCSWGIWLMLLLLFAVFIAMVLFIRIAPKPR